MTPVLFLDFDGPLFPERHIPHSRSIREYPGKLGLHPFINYWEMDRTSVRQLNALYSMYDFDTVISSSWQNYVDLPQIQELFRVNGLDLHIHPDWGTELEWNEGNPLGRRSSNRARNIGEWLDAHAINSNVPSHIILDDPQSGSSLDEVDLAHIGVDPASVHMVNPDVGIDSDLFKNMKSIVNSWFHDYNTRIYKQIPFADRRRVQFG